MTEVSSELLLLQNNNFMERQIKFYKKVREEEDMFDVTIACDGVEVRAHKLVISASSPVFRRIIKSSNHPNPFIYLKGLHPQDLESIINFVYTGETKVEANNIQSFMNSASELQISGLSEEPLAAIREVETELREDEKESLTVTSPKTNKKAIKRKSEDTESSPGMKKTGDKTDKSPEKVEAAGVLNESIKVKEEVEVEPDVEEEANMSMTKPIGTTITNGDINEALDREIAQRMENIVDKTGQKLTRCTVCGKTFKQKSKAKFHIETHIEGFSHTCNICGATAKTKKSLSVHIYNRHTKTNKQQE